MSDLIAFWNLRAADIALFFVDRTEADRCAKVIPVWKKRAAELISHQRVGSTREYAIWSCRGRMSQKENLDAVRRTFGDESHVTCDVSEHLWNGMNIKPPLMHLGEVDSLGVLITEGGKPKVSFGLNDRPYATHSWFHTQHLGQR